MIEHALWLASNGFSIFPLRPGLKTPATKNGFKDATRDEAQIRVWWGMNPAANIGIATGAASNCFVVDVDGFAGEAALQLLGALPETLEACTPGKVDKRSGEFLGKGRHLFFLYPGAVATIGASQIGEHLDHRSDGGYVVAAPSVHPDGTGSYAWSRLAPMAPLPQIILERLAAPKRQPAPAVHNVSRAAPVSAPVADVDSARESLSLQGHVDALIHAKPGTKHSVLVAASWAHACAAHEAREAREVSEPRLLNLLCAALAQNLLSPVDDWSNAENAVRSALDKAYARPLEAQLQSYEIDFTEDGLARRFARVFRCNTAFVPGQGWRVFDGRRWSDIAGNGQPTDAVSKLLIELEADLVRRDDTDLAKSIKAKRTSGTMSAILRLAQRYMAVPFDAFDRDPNKLNCLNGTVNLLTGELCAHAPTDLITRCCTVSYASAPCDSWLRALLQMQRGDVSAIEYLRLLFGSFLQGSPIDGFWLMYGNGFDGKSTVLQILHGVMGDYASALNPQSILVAKSGQRPHTSIMGGLAGRRLGTIDEFPADCQLDTGAVKSYFGRLPVRLQPGMGKDFVDVTPSAKGLGATNHLLRIDETDYGTQRRIQVIPFDANLRSQGVVKDDGFPLRLLAQEGSGILSWLVSGCLAWRASGEHLPRCERVDAATAELFGDSDTAGRYLETCQYGPERTCTADELYKAYSEFAGDAGDYVMSKRAFGNRMRERGLTPYKGGKGVRMYVGIKPAQGVGQVPPPQR